MLYFLENDNLKVGVESFGAELQHFIRLSDQQELIWQGNPAIWPGHAPNLFPIVGALPHNQFTHEGKTYQMLRHGFARRTEFDLVEEKKDKLVFQLKQSEETLSQYPFKFSLLIAFKLEGNSLSTTYQVTNTDHEALYFSVGGHPGFNVPLYPGEQYSDYYLEFEQPETLVRYLIDEAGLQSGETERVLTESAVLPLQHEYFEKDAIVLKDVKSEKVILASRKSAYRLEMDFKGFPYLGIWTKPGASPFVCIEPWCGITSHEGDTGELKEKEGIEMLSPEAIFERTYTLTVL
ncbi:aldose 1-epimerase family protein [Pontibacter sp. SGAir0037]|uniref:aldose 1-epimerase family protein n=1 Tax=Pontibacter sp. SGAir0037 TaxID=2571030 RepID=UPI0010CD4DEA|nr:aldose 1-epimerase family protein [Pontibacter sp. SGAir0037]QCR23377.1 aldose epimerase [Pontibacter sp. SGAir0037]